MLANGYKKLMALRQLYPAFPGPPHRGRGFPGRMMMALEGTTPALPCLRLGTRQGARRADTLPDSLQATRSRQHKAWHKQGLEGLERSNMGSLTSIPQWF